MPTFNTISSQSNELRAIQKDRNFVTLLVLTTFLIFAVLFTTTHYLVTQHSLDEMNIQQNELAHQSTKKGIAFYLDELHKRLNLFVDSHQNLIEELAEHPDDDIAYDDLFEQASRYFPQMGSFSIADEHGDPLFEDINDIIQGICIHDTKKALQTHHAETRLHPNPIFPHIDIISTYTDNEGHQRTFLISYRASLIAHLLQQFTPANSEQLLVSALNPTRIEFTPFGFRHQTPGKWDLKPNEIDTLPNVFQSPIPNTQWILITYTSSQKLLEDRQKLRKILIQDMLIELLFGLLLFGLLRKVLDHAVNNVHLLHYTATHDPLTDLYNRLHFISLLSHSMHIAHRERNPLALLFIDLDGFKPINDHYGHEAGDFVLKEVAKRLQSNRRETDLVARLGGDEFVIALPDIKDEATLHRIIDQIRHSLHDPITLPNGQQVSVDASIGYAIYLADTPVSKEMVDELIKEADDMMYEEKEKHHHSR